MIHKEFKIIQGFRQQCELTLNKLSKDFLVKALKMTEDNHGSLTILITIEKRQDYIDTSDCGH